MAVLLTRGNCGVLRSTVYTMYSMRHDDDDDGGGGGDVEWNGNEEDGNVRSECEEDEDTDWVDGNNDIDWLR